VASQRHAGVERFARGAGGLAGATPTGSPGPGRAGEPYAVWLEDWRADGLNAEGSAVRLVARDAASSLSLDLELLATKPLVAHGDRGLSAKGDGPGNASFYVGYTRMAARGRIGTNGALTDVAGEAWFDHEWSTSALGPGAVGWDWFSLQLDDGRELMHFQIRRDDGAIEPASGGTLVEKDGRPRRLARDDVGIEVLRRWTSPETGGTYPSRWRLTVPSESLDLPGGEAPGPPVRLDQRAGGRALDRAVLAPEPEVHELAAVVELEGQPVPADGALAEGARAPLVVEPRLAGHRDLSDSSPGGHPRVADVV
jgi:predicted secreted hydrolase